MTSEVSWGHPIQKTLRGVNARIHPSQGWLRRVGEKKPPGSAIGNRSGLRNWSKGLGLDDDKGEELFWTGFQHTHHQQ
jgi:hypothetical protein